MRKLKKIPISFAQLWTAQKSTSSGALQKEADTAASRALSDEYGDFFRYTSGRWMYDEQMQMAKRYVKFNVQALQQIAGQALQSRCVEMRKLPEGLNNKVLSLSMENGQEILARIPNPNAGHPHYVVASEVATLDFLRNVLGIPVPRVIEWSSRKPASPNPVDAEYILMERMTGHQLCDVWPAMSEAKRFGLVKSIVEMERKLTAAKLSKYGSIYYRSDHPHGSKTEESSILATSGIKDTSRFVIGPVTQQSFWADEKSDLDIDRGPWDTAEEYLSAVAKCEIAWIRACGSRQLEGIPLLSEMKLTTPEIHIRLLEQFLCVLPYIIPRGTDIDNPVLWHHDLHPQNIFVDDTDPTKVTGIIDWQAVWAAPLFIQARFPSVFNCDGSYPWGAVEPMLPKEFDSLSESDKESASHRLEEKRLKKFYEVASRKFNPLVFKALDAMRNEDNPITFIFDVVGRTGVDGPIPLKELLIQTYEKWDWIVKGKGIDVPCPISFTNEEIQEARQQAQAWAATFNEYDGLRAQIVGKDGWVSHEEYDEAMAQFSAHKETLEDLRERLDSLSGARSTR